MTAQLYLIIPPLPVDHANSMIRHVLAAAPFASACLTAEATGALGEAALEPVIRTIQGFGVAALIEDDAALAKRIGADGVHLSQVDEDGVAIGAARSLMPSGIIGAEAGLSRHLAMINGEKGADYIAFSRSVARDHEIGSIGDMVQWWSELFELSCVAFAEDENAAVDLARYGADFVALNSAIWASADGPAAAAKRLAAQLSR